MRVRITKVVATSVTIAATEQRMWSSAGLGPPTYRPFEFPYEEYRSGVGDFPAAPPSWPAATPPAHTAVSSPQEDRIQEDSVRYIKKINK